MRKVEVVPYNPDWGRIFETESKLVKEALGEITVAVHHIGSTAIPGICAKPIIDLLIEVTDIEKVDLKNSEMESLGYEVMGEYGIPERRYFRKENREGIRTYHIHMFKVATDQVTRHLAFRDYLIAHPKEAQKYSELKMKLARKFPTNIDGYIEGKNGFVQEIEQKALQWFKQSGRM